MNDTFQDLLAPAGTACLTDILMCSQEGALHAEKVQMALAIFHDHRLFAKLDTHRFLTSGKWNYRGISSPPWNTYLACHSVNVRLS